MSRIPHLNLLFRSHYIRSYHNADYYSAAECNGCSAASWYGSDFDKKRLRLNLAQESSCNGPSLPKYEFFYNTQPLPKRYSLARDMWGYYNGFDGNTGLLETFTNAVLLDVTYTTSNVGVLMQLMLKPVFWLKSSIPQVGLTDRNNITTHYDYDGFGRLIRVRDHENNLLKTYSYHYKQ